MYHTGVVQPFDYQSAAEWIYDHMFGAESLHREEKHLVEDGIIEVSRLNAGHDNCLRMVTA